jgi:septum site-determining protein MinC
LDSVAPSQKTSIRFRARSLVAFSLSPEAPFDAWLERLDRWTANSPGFFVGRPVMLDLSNLTPAAAEIERLVSQLAERGLRIYAIQAAGLGDLGPDLPPVLAGGSAPSAEESVAQPEGDNRGAVPADIEGSNSLTIHAPIRSGQSIFHPHGDVIVLGSVGSGSEIIAGGSIHVYGTLRGRVFAGAKGDPDARIFCRRNEAELLAVDGWYRTADDMEPSTRGIPVQAFLDGGVIQVAALN